MDFDYFTNDGIPMFKPAYIPNWQTLQRPLRARFISAHFLFAPGSFVQEVPYNPDIYFQGEEITLSVRAYTCGYDLFHPPEALLWHEYSRENRSKHWDDHVEAADVELPWHRRDAKSREQVCDFLTASRAGMYGCGSVRTVAQYQAYAGISFSHKKVQDYTLRGAEPPNPTADANWAEAIQTWCVRIEFERNRLPAVAFADAQFWYVGLHDSTGAEIYRNDLSGDKLIGLTSGNSEHILFEREFQSSRTPVSWTVWPFSHSGGWLDKIDGPASLRYSESI
jgi:hypothetical protein